MLNPSLSNLLVEARIETLHQAARNDGRGRRGSGPAGQIDRSPSGSTASPVTRVLARVFDRGRRTRDEAAGIHAVIRHGSAATWSQQS